MDVRQYLHFFFSHPVVHFCCPDLAVGRLSISSPRQGRCALIFVKVCLDHRFVFKWRASLSFSQSSYCYLTLLASLPSLPRSTVPSHLLQLSALSLDLSLLRMRMKVRAQFSLWTLIHFGSSGKRRFDCIRREGRLLVCRRTCNRYPRKADSQCNY